jgi:hypothetical protein
MLRKCVACRCRNYEYRERDDGATSLHIRSLSHKMIVVLRGLAALSRSTRPGGARPVLHVEEAQLLGVCRGLSSDYAFT